MSGVRRRIAYKDPAVGELARDVDDELRRLKAAITALEARVANTNAGPIGSDDVTNESGVTGSTVSDALDTLDASVYTDEDAQDAIGGIVLPSSGPVRLTYSDATPSITVAVDDLVGDSGSGGTKGLVPAPSSGDGAAGKMLRADGAWAVPPSGGTPITWWNPDAKPLVPHAQDDEFDGTSTATWGDWDPGNVMTYSVDTDRQAAVLTNTGTGSPGTIQWAGRYQAVPGSEFAVYAKINLIGETAANYSVVGLFVSQDLAANPSTADFRVCTYGQDATTALGNSSANWSAYNGTASASAAWTNLLVRYVRIRMNGTSFAGDASPDGVTWHNFATATLGYTPTHFGMISLAPTGRTIKCVFDFVRVFSGSGTSGIDATKIGRFVTGAGALNLWSPDARPVIAHACDDEFDGSGIDPKWTDYDHGTYGTNSIDTTRKMLRISGIGNGSTDRLTGLLQPIPNAEFTVYTRVAFETTASSSDAGIVVTDGTGSGADLLQLVALHRTGTQPRAGRYSWSAYNTFVNNTNDASLTPPLYTRLRMNGTSYACDVSADGVWWLQFTSGTVGFTPTHFGLAATFVPAVAHAAIFHFFRVFSGSGVSGIGATQIGRNVSVAA